MANMCDNSVIFTGDPIAIENVKALFNEIQETQDRTQKWHLPPYVTADFSHMQEIAVNDNAITYETRWYPNFGGLIQIADHHELGFVNNYDEMGNGIFGQAIYKNNIFNDFRLEPDDFSCYHYDPHTSLYVFDNKNYSFEWPIFEEMLARKKEKYQQISNQRPLGYNR